MAPRYGYAPPAFTSTKVPIANGKLQVWNDVSEVLNPNPGEVGKDIPPAIKIGVDFYPVSVLLNKGIILGIESELVQRRDTNFSYFKFSTRVCQSLLFSIFTLTKWSSGD